MAGGRKWGIDCSKKSWLSALRRMILSYRDVTVPCSECTARHWKSAIPVGNLCRTKQYSISNVSPWNFQTSSKCIFLLNTLHTRWSSRPTLEFIRCSNHAEDIHVDLCVFGVILPYPSAHSKEEVAWWDTVATQRVTERVLGSVAQLKASVENGECLWNQHKKFAQLSMRLIFGLVVGSSNWLNDLNWHWSGI